MRRSAGSFRYALAGVRYLFATQPNARAHLALALLALTLGIVLGLSPVELALIVLTIGVVLALEALNTALEALTDLAHPGYHPLARIAKDLAAAAVLLGAVAGVAVAALLFTPRLWSLLIGR